VIAVKQGESGHKGRGALGATAHRFSVWAREQEDDGWQHEERDDEAPPPKTIVTDENVKSLITRNQSPDLPFSLSINPYRGCEHDMWSSSF